MKFKVSHDEIKKIIVSKGAEFVKSDYNYDIYYEHPSRDYSKTDEALRIRETERGRYITYKGPKVGKKSKTREEIEIPIEGDNFPQLLEKLEFNPAGIVNKHRDTWKLDEFTITFDKVEDLGEFVEVEVVKSESSISESSEQELVEFISELGLDPEKQILTSYLELVLKH